MNSGLSRYLDQSEMTWLKSSRLDLSQVKKRSRPLYVQISKYRQITLAVATTLYYIANHITSNPLPDISKGGFTPTTGTRRKLPLIQQGVLESTVSSTVGPALSSSYKHIFMHFELENGILWQFFWYLHATFLGSSLIEPSWLRASRFDLLWCVKALEHYNDGVVAFIYSKYIQIIYR